MALFKYIVLSVCLCGIHLNGFAQSTREAILEDIARTGGVYYAYPVKEAIATPPPKGYKPFYISHYARHGSRWIQSEQDYKTVVDIFEKAHQAGALTALGEDVRKRMALVWEDAEGHGGDLTPLGVRQHRGIAERMFQNYPEVFKGSPALSARSTVVLRCVLSMDAFCERLKELNPALQIRREACARYMKYMNYHTPEAVKFVSHQGPWYEEYRKFKESHTRPDRLVTSLFNSPDYIRKNVNPGELMWGLYWIASDMQNVEIDVSFYDKFYQAWCNFKVTPMAANVQLVFFRKKASDDILVKFMHCEKEVTIPIETDIAPFYHWKDVETYYRHLLHKLP